MTDEIYLVDPATRSATLHGPARFADIGITERADLQEWILSHPEILGEPLLIITSEFAGFDRSNRRLDLLGLDPDGNLVIIELKLELQHTFADLQALRYAAFCATMTIDQVVDEFAKYHGVSSQIAITAVSDFLEVEEEDLPEPSDRPRVILVAGSMDDPEVISTVLWLRNFDLDIRCLEVTPYKASEKQIILVPRLIVPLPEAEAYQVRVERKESVKAKKKKDPGPYAALWEGIRREFNALDTLFEITRKPARSHLQIMVGEGGWHYEWQVKKKAGEFHVAVHFESGERSENIDRLELLREHSEEIGKDLDVPFNTAEWGKKWAYGGYVIPLEEVLEDPESACAKTAKLMDTLMRRSYPLLTAEETFPR